MMGRRGWQGALMRGFGARDHEATLLRREALCDNVVRLHLHSPTVLDDVVVGPTAWLRFWFPDPDGSATEHQRAYTLSLADPASGDFAVDVVLHEPAGPASHWGAHARVGDVVGVMSLGSTAFALPPELPAGYLLVGDSASIPAINGILATVPAHVPIELYLEQHDPADRDIPLVAHPRARVRWVPRTGPESLAAAIEDRDYSDWYAWAGPESASLKHLRTRLRDSFGFPKTEMHAQAYWVHGRKMGTSRGPETQAGTGHDAVDTEATAGVGRAPAGPEARPAGAEATEMTAGARATTAGANPAHAPANTAAGPTPDDPIPTSTGPITDQAADPRGSTHPTPGVSPSPTPAPTPRETPGVTEGAETGEGTAPTELTEAGEAPESGNTPATTGTPETPRRGSWRAAGANRLLAPLKGTFWAAGIAAGVLTLLDLAPWLVLVEACRRLLAGADAASLTSLGVWALVLLGASAVANSLLTLVLHVRDAGFSRELRARLLAKLARVPLGWFTARGSGSVTQVVQGDTAALHHLVVHAIPDAVAAVLAPLVVLTYLFVVDWRLALVMLIPVLAYVVLMYVMIVQSATRMPEAARWVERMKNEASGYLDAQPVVRVFDRTARSGFLARLEEYTGFLHAWQRPFTSLKSTMDLVTRPTTFLLLIVVFGTLRVTLGGSPADLVPFLLLGTSIGSRLLALGYGLGGLREGLAAARRVQAVLEAPELAVRTAKLGGDASHDRGDVPPGRVEFAGVDFAYRAGVPVLTGVDLVLEPGTVTALVGPSGSGKSTLAALLARFHDVGAGVVRVGGDDVRDLTPDELYSRVGFVLQDPQLVEGSVAENIALARPDAPREDVEAAARAARIHDRIAAMPRGYDTLLGRDAALSGGERQRLTIARALLADTPVLVLDEATAFADPESEYEVQRALDELTAGRTVLVVAHRLHTITGVDRIVVLDGGRVVESGTHPELLATGGRYSRLWEASGSAPDEVADPDEGPRRADGSDVGDVGDPNPRHHGDDSRARSTADALQEGPR